MAIIADTVVGPADKPMINGIMIVSSSYGGKSADLCSQVVLARAHSLFFSFFLKEK